MSAPGIEELVELDLVHQTPGVQLTPKGRTWLRTLHWLEVPSESPSPPDTEELVLAYVRTH